MALAGRPHRCLYEILGIELKATYDEIRAAYKTLALKLHPDKAALNGFSLEEATARFQEILRAYEILYDPRERSWYDFQRSKIQSSASSSSAKNSASSSTAEKRNINIKLSSYFSTSVYSFYGDTGKGFFKVYGDLFQTLSKQEIAYAQSIGAAPVPAAPLIGNLETADAEVCAFYNYWRTFSTVKDFSSVGDSSVSAVQNRKKKRVRKYNETVRQLAQFVKKRDKRVLESELKRKKEEEEEDVEAKRRWQKWEKERKMEEEAAQAKRSWQKMEKERKKEQEAAQAKRRPQKLKKRKLLRDGQKLKKEKVVREEKFEEQECGRFDEFKNENTGSHENQEWGRVDEDEEMFEEAGGLIQDI